MTNINRSDVSRTSYEIRWKRSNPQPRPDFNASPDAALFVTPEGEPLFTVVTHGGPSEGVLSLIAEAPRMRDEVDGEQRKENAYVDGLEAIVRHIAGMIDPEAGEFEYGQIHRQLIYDAREALGDSHFPPARSRPED